MISEWDAFPEWDMISEWDIFPGESGWTIFGPSFAQMFRAGWMLNLARSTQKL